MTQSHQCRDVGTRRRIDRFARMRPWPRECFITLALLSSCCGLPSGRCVAQGAAPDRPNIVLFYVDDLRADGIGAGGHAFVQTPNIDRIASEGIRFDRSYATTPLCSPSRASLLTGQHVSRHHVHGNEGYKSVSDFRLRTYPQVLDQAGYETAHIGKYHQDENDARREGYDHWAVFQTPQGSHLNPRLNINGQRRAHSGFTTDVLTDVATSFIDAVERGIRTEPFAMTVSYKALHLPFGAAFSQHAGQYDGEPIVHPPSAQSGYALDGKPMIRRDSLVEPMTGHPVPVPGENEFHDPVQRRQMEMLTDIDDGVGRVLDRLEQTGMLDDTVVIFTSDQGYFWGEHGLTSKLAAYDESVRTPLLVRMPDGTGAGTVVDDLTLNIDVAPTILDAAGVAVPDWMQGRSLLPHIRGEAVGPRAAFLSQYDWDLRYPWIASWEAVNTSRYRYIRYPVLGAAANDPEAWDELYDLEVDPHEMNNVIDDDIYQEVLAQLKQLHVDLVREARSVSRGSAHVPSDWLDYNLVENGSTNPHGRLLRVGAHTTGGRNAVMLFELPPLPADHRIEQATLTLTVASTTGLTPDHNADLWVLGISDSEPLIEYLESPDDSRPDHVLLQDNLLVGTILAGPVFTDAQAGIRLADYLMDFYDQNPSYLRGQFVFLRLNPDSDFGNDVIEWTVGSASHADAQARPLLTLQVVPEPTTFALLFIAFLLRVGRRTGGARANPACWAGLR